MPKKRKYIRKAEDTNISKLYSDAAENAKKAGTAEEEICLWHKLDVAVNSRLLALLRTKRKIAEKLENCRKSMEQI